MDVIWKTVARGALLCVAATNGPAQQLRCLQHSTTLWAALMAASPPEEWCPAAEGFTVPPNSAAPPMGV